MKEKLYLILSVVKNHLAFKKKQTFLVVAGVSVGAMVMILTFAITNGIIFEIKSKIIEVSPLITVKGEKVVPKEHLLFSNKNKNNYYIKSRIPPDNKNEIKPYMQVVSQLDSIKEIDAVSPYVFARGVLRLRTLTKPCFIKGIIPGRERNIADLSKKIETGSLAELGYTTNGVLLGSGLAKKLKAAYHDIIQLIDENGNIYSLVIVGTFSTGFSAVDDHNIFINLKFAQNLKGYPDNVVTAIGLHTRTLDEVDPVAKLVSRISGYKTETWEEANANLIDLFERNNNITLFLVIFVFIVAGFGIANVLITIVLQKRTDIAIMKSFGLSKRSIEAIFITEGLILGLVGTIIGEVAGYYLAGFISTLPISFGEGAVIRSDHLVTYQTAISFFITAFFSIAVSIVAGWSPARKAAKSNPIEVIRA
jgi:lipoprotein-releasing system permease protein